MKVTFLGTGTSQGVPVIACPCPVCQSADPRDKRLRTSALVEWEGKQLLIDAGPDFRQQMLREAVQHLDAILLTHDHKDHVGGLDDVRAFNYITKAAMRIYCTQYVLAGLQRDYHYAFAEHKYPGVPEFDVWPIENRPFQIDGLPIRPFEGLHHRLPVLGFRLGDFSYITDMNYISDAEQEKIRGSRVVAINALRHTEHISHFTLAQALALIERWQPERAYLIHISHQLGTHAQVQAQLPANVFLAYDGLSIEI